MFGTKKITLTEQDLAQRIARAYRDGVDSEKTKSLLSEGATKIDLFGLKEEGVKMGTILRNILDTGFALAKDNKKITGLTFIGDAFNPTMIVEWRGSRGETIVNKPSMEEIEKLRARSKATADEAMKEVIAQFMVKVARDAKKSRAEESEKEVEENEEECDCPGCTLRKLLKDEQK